MTEVQPVKTEDRRQMLLQAAERCFIESGFHGARMAQIAKQARMSPGHIYHYFESKEQIIAEMVRSHVDEKQTMIEELERAGDRVIDLLIENVKDNVDKNPDTFWSALMLEMTAEATRDANVAAILRGADAEMKARVMKSLGAGVIQEDLETRLEVLVALIQGVGIRSILNPDLDKKAFVRLMRQIVDSLFRKENGKAGV
ncbi:MAG: TetR/AcrR family transcriptional regulator [Parvularculaceae bacterium]|nr:TetR/AcrR family transcriptional regulator [Parvularculaceae bacterium]